jgi:hypothetical protein
MKTIVQKMIAAGAGLFLTTNAAVYGTTIYSDSKTDTGGSLNFVNGTTIGDEIQMTGAGTLTSFSFEYYSPDSTFSGTVTMDVTLYANDGNPPGSPNFYNYNNTPSTILYNSGAFTLQPPEQALNNPSANYATLTFNNPTYNSLPVTVPQDFTLAIDVAGLVPANGDVVGVELFSSPTVGSNLGDYWYDDSTGWRLNSLTGTETGFGAEITAVPEPSAYGAIAGAWLLALCSLRVWRQRRRNV